MCVSTIPDECTGVGTEISTVGGRRKQDPPENRSGRLWRNPLLCELRLNELTFR